MSVSAAAIALGIVGSVAAAPVTGTKPAGKTPKPNSSKNPAPPKISKWRQHIQDMLRVSAPGDEYFGRLKMSFLGINNTFRDDLIRAGAYTTDPKTVSAINFADEALTAWARKYPNDPQLARSYFLAFQMYRKVWVQTYQDKAWDYAHIVMKKWPNSFFGKALKRDIAIGFTEHYFATPLPCAAFAVVGPSPSPGSGALATPLPTPQPTPTPTPAPGRPKAEVLPVPCSTPTPTPTPLPTPSPLPTGSLAPSPLPTGSLAPSPLPTTTVSPAPTATPIPPSAAPSGMPSPRPTRSPHR